MHFFHHRLHAWHEHHAGRHGRPHHHGFFGFGHQPFAEGFPGGRGGGGGFGPGRKLGSADLQLLLLALLAEKPSHGYELIKALEERSSGYYAPSPGMVYPALTYLEEIGFATVQTEGTKKLYSVTATGLAHLQENRPAVDTLLEQLAWIGRRMEHLRHLRRAAGPEGEGSSEHAAGGENGDAHWGRGQGLGRGQGRGRGRDREPQFEDGQPGENSGPELQVARFDLKLALSEKAGAPREEQQRIAAILRQAAADIRSA